MSAIVGGLEHGMTEWSGYVCCNSQLASHGTEKAFVRASIFIIPSRWGRRKRWFSGNLVRRVLSRACLIRLKAEAKLTYFSHSTVLYAVNRGS